ncbi:hypothetical protein CSA37_08890 [Candidatus Fermentibacteria bacterium]|nr:MAG: hypothetical protein CSA37_08890 [Candidatus Fermentibacteria bacterium]
MRKGFLIVAITGLCIPSEEQFSQGISDSSPIGCDAAAMSLAGLSYFPEGICLDECVFSSDLIDVEPLSECDINRDFSNTGDLDWLVDAASGVRCVLAGENHYYRFIEHLKNRIIFALNRNDYFHLVVFENQYSLTPFLNHYLEIEENEAAEIFLNEELADWLSFDEEIIRLRHIRRWNRTFPEKWIHIGCSDIEHNFRGTFERILVPFLQEIAPEYDFPVEEVTLENIQALLPEFRQMVEESDVVQPGGCWSFITKPYILNVILNLESTCKAKADRRYFIRHRQEAIIRNLTSPDFLGEYFHTGKVIIFAGSFHTGTVMDNSGSDADYFTEGAYLTNEYDATRNSTFSIQLTGYAMTLESMAGIDLNTNRHLGREYREYITSLNRAYAENLIARETPVLLWPMDHLDMFMLNATSERDFQPARIVNFDTEQVLREAESVSPEFAEQIERKLYYIPGSHDVSIIIP